MDVLKISKNNENDNLIASLIYDSLLHMYLISSAKMTSERSFRFMKSRKHSFIIENKLNFFIKDKMKKIQNAFKNKEELSFSLDESKLIEEIVYHAWESSIQYENKFEKSTYQNTLSFLSNT